MEKETITKEFEDDFLMVEDDEDAQANKYMLFKTAEEVYGIEIKYVTEIIELQRITEVPDMPNYVKGVINLRGRVIPVIDIRLRFSMEAREYDDRSCIIVVNIDETSIGFVVDTVAEVQDIPEGDIEPAPNFKTKSGKERYISGMGKVGDEVKILLDVSKILYESDLETIKNIDKPA